MALIEPTPDEARNGWTAESLTRYLRACGVEDGISGMRLPDRRKEISVETADDSHDPHNW